MPLAHETLSHGPVAFGFYNIDTDALLLDRYFFFATDFSRAAIDLAGRGQACLDPAWRFGDPAAIGDLMGAIHGVRHTGYLGEVYRRWPFPNEPQAFRQKLDCAATRDDSQALLARHAEPCLMEMSQEPDGTLALGPYRFSRPQFLELVAYVRRGGWPTWENYENGACPDFAASLSAAWR
jgi:hypothetical protein